MVASLAALHAQPPGDTLPIVRNVSDLLEHGLDTVRLQGWYVKVTHGPSDDRLDDPYWAICTTDGYQFLLGDPASAENKRSPMERLRYRNRMVEVVGKIQSGFGQGPSLRLGLVKDIRSIRRLPRPRRGDR